MKLILTIINNCDKSYKIIVTPKYISPEEGEFFDYDEYMKIEASKSKDMNK